MCTTHTRLAKSGKHVLVMCTAPLPGCSDRSARWEGARVVQAGG